MGLLVRSTQGVKFNRGGFSIAELLITLGIFALLMTTSYVALQTLQNTTTTTTSLDVLLGDMRLTQSVAMLGRSADRSNALATGVYFVRNTPEYVIFDCPTQEPCWYSEQMPGVLRKRLEGPLIFLETTLTQDQIVFLPYSGEVAGLEQGRNTITIANTTTNARFQIGINRLGSYTVSRL